jgi:hypothetical protein
VPKGVNKRTLFEAGGRSRLAGNGEAQNRTDEADGVGDDSQQEIPLTGEGRTFGELALRDGFGWSGLTKAIVIRGREEPLTPSRGVVAENGENRAKEKGPEAGSLFSPLLCTIRLQSITSHATRITDYFFSELAHSFGQHGPGKTPGIRITRTGRSEEFFASVLIPVATPHDTTEKYVVAVHIRLPLFSRAIHVPN